MMNTIIGILIFIISVILNISPSLSVWFDPIYNVMIFLWIAVFYHFCLNVLSIVNMRTVAKTSMPNLLLLDAESKQNFIFILFGNLIALAIHFGISESNFYVGVFFSISIIADLITYVIKVQRIGNLNAHQQKQDSA